MGFGIKTDFATGRKLDLNKSYNALIKPIVQQKGLVCVRADEILHSGVIDVVMYQELLQADVVIADLSTANPNVFYELGIRHALRPFTTIVISENKMPYPFDLNHVTIKSYTHLCDVIDYDEVIRFQGILGETLDKVLQQPTTDSPVYTYLNGLIPPSLQQRAAEVAADIGEAIKQSPGKKKRSIENKTIALLAEQGEASIAKQKYESAKANFGAVMEMLERTNKEEGGSINTYIYQRLALCIYKSKRPFRLPVTSSKSANHSLALQEAMELLTLLNLRHTNDPETLSLAGAIEKKLYEKGEGDDHLSNAMIYFQRTFFLLYTRYNAINLAYLWLCQANSNISNTEHEKIADLVNARRMWKMVVEKCDKDWEEVCNRQQRADALEGEEGKKEEQRKCDLDQKFWILANKAEASFGLGDMAAYETSRATMLQLPHEPWMLESCDNQLSQMKHHLGEVGHLVGHTWTEKPEVAV